MSLNLFAGAGIMVVGAAVGGFFFGASHNDNKWSAKWHSAIAAQQSALLMEQAKNRQIEQDWNTKLRTAEVAHAKDKQSIQVARDRADAESRGLRDIIASHAASIPTEDTLSACRERAAALGELFADADAEAGRMAEAAEKHALDVSRLDSWAKIVVAGQAVAEE